MMTKFLSPEGVEIVGTADTLPATAYVNGFTLEDGKWEPNYTGDTDCKWDDQAPLIDPKGGIRVVCERNKIWSLSACTPVGPT